MRLDLEGARPPVPNIDDPGVLSRPLQHALAPRRQPLQMHARRLVGAVLTPHHAEDAQFGEGWFPTTEKLFDLLVFVRRKSVLPDGFQRESRSQKSGHWRNYYCRISPRGGGNKSVCSGGRIRPPAGACTRHPKDGVRLLSPDSKPDPGSKINRQGRISDHFVVAPIQRIFDVDVRGHMRIHFVPTAEICANVSGSMINAEPEEITVGSTANKTAAQIRSPAPSQIRERSGPRMLGPPQQRLPGIVNRIEGSRIIKILRRRIRICCVQQQ